MPFCCTSAFTIRPRLPPYTRSSKFSVSRRATPAFSTAGEYSFALPPSWCRTAPLASSRFSMVITVRLVQPVSGFSAATSWVMVRGAACHSWFISFHSPAESSTPIVLPSP